MNTRWLLLFKEDITALKSSVQYALFEEYVRLAAASGLLLGLNETNARLVVKTVFLQAASRRFADKNEIQINEHLMRMTEGAVLKHQTGAGCKSDAGVQAEQLMEAWNDIAPVLQRKVLRRRRFRLMLSVCSFAVILIIGGFAFGTTTPAQKSAKVAAPPNKESDGSELTQPVSGIQHPLKVTAEEARQYADFQLGIPQILPDGYHFEEALVFLSGQETKSRNIVLVYTNEENYLLRVLYNKLAPRSALSTGVTLPESMEEIFLRGSKALLVKTKDNYSRLDWLEGDTYTSISGRDIDDRQLVSMAESLQ